MRSDQKTFDFERNQKLIIDALRSFQLSERDVEAICSRMLAYIDAHLAAPCTFPDPTQTPGLNADQVEIIRIVLAEIDWAIRKWKDSIFIERLSREIEFVDPDALQRSGSRPLGVLLQ